MNDNFVDRSFAPIFLVFRVEFSTRFEKSRADSGLIERVRLSEGFCQIAWKAKTIERGWRERRNFPFYFRLKECCAFWVSGVCRDKRKRRG